MKHEGFWLMKHGIQLSVSVRESLSTSIIWEKAAYSNPEP